MTSDSILTHGREIDPDLGIAIEAALAAGDVIREGSGKMHDVEFKGVGDLVSEVDTNADVAIAKVLHQHSTLPVLSEESSPTLDAGVSDFWIVDPLDATSAFLTQAGPQYPSVLINRQQDGITTSSVVYFPLTEEWFYAAKGRGAWKDGKRLIVSDEPMTLLESWVEMNQYADNSLETELFSSMRQRLRSKYGARLVTTNPPHSGVAVRIAESKSSLSVAIHDNSADHVKQAAWDIAAPRLVLQEAGGVFLNFSGEELDLFMAEPFVVARTESLAREVIELFETQPT
ncbi:inositol monophosphatase family protein [Mariniblastus fucicola]|uniref:Inositol-1-monophosphatase n=1 Tax=Mariniblastus fucicola TaxID=980251 RepID=A0A5B9P5Z1_9BACT|nr:inositol monophosphatase [Mariniblastus fucicola]QEG20340.1 Inositol-1-monophosphatase [Mariniblastus fucicola]